LLDFNFDALVFATTPFLRILGLTLNFSAVAVDLDLVDLVDFADLDGAAIYLVLVLV
jgi:hypothetical protein